MSNPPKISRLTWEHNSLVLGGFVLVLLVGYFFGHQLDGAAQNLKEHGYPWLSDWVNMTPKQWRGRSMFILLIVVGLYGLVVKGPERVDLASPLVWVIGGYFLICTLSMWWSVDYFITFRRLNALLATVLSAWAMARWLNPYQVAKIILVVCLVYLGISLMVDFTIYGMELFSLKHRFGGTMHPNGQGIQMAMLFLAALSLTKDVRGTTRYLYFIVAVVAFFFIILTKTRAGLTSSLVAGGLIWMWGGSLQKKLLSVCIFGCLVSVAFFVAAELGDTSLPLKLLMPRLEGDGTVFSGRFIIWRMVWDLIEERPLLGYGYNTIWTDEFVQVFSFKAGWQVTEAHSAYLEAALGTGIIGMGLFVTLVVFAISKASFLAFTGPNPGRFLVLGVLLVAALCSITESAFTNISFATFVFFWALAWLCRSSRDRHDLPRKIYD